MDSDMPDNLSEDQISAAQEKAWDMLEGRALSWIDQLRASIKGRRGSHWKSNDAAQRTARSIEEDGNDERAIEDAIADVNAHLRRLLGLYAASHQNPNRGMGDLSQAFQDFLRVLHNPETREVLLLAVKEEYRDDIRAWFEEIGMASWGVVDLAEGNQTEEFWFVAKQLADMQDRSVEDMVREMDGVSMDEVPPGVRER